MRLTRIFMLGEYDKEEMKQSGEKYSQCVFLVMFHGIYVVKQGAEGKKKKIVDHNYKEAPVKWKSQTVRSFVENGVGG